MCHEEEPLGPNCVVLISAVSEGLHTVRLWYVFLFANQMIYRRTRTLALKTYVLVCWPYEQLALISEN